MQRWPCAIQNRLTNVLINNVEDIVVFLVWKVVFKSDNTNMVSAVEMLQVTFDEKTQSKMTIILNFIHLYFIHIRSFSILYMYCGYWDQTFAVLKINLSVIQYLHCNYNLKG